MSKKFIPILEYARRAGISRGRIYWKIINGDLKKGTDFQEVIVKKKLLVIREDLII